MSTATLARVTLAELLVVIALLSTVFAGTLTALEQGQRAYTLGVARVEAQQNGRIALERLTREIRNAGAGGVGFDAIAVAERERVVLHMDQDGDGGPMRAARRSRGVWPAPCSGVTRGAGRSRSWTASGASCSNTGTARGVPRPSRGRCGRW